jgi:hypothetical protein
MQLEISKCSGLDVFAINILARTANKYIHSTVLYFLSARLYKVPSRRHVKVERPLRCHSKQSL